MEILIDLVETPANSWAGPHAEMMLGPMSLFHMGDSIPISRTVLMKIIADDEFIFFWNEIV